MDLLIFKACAISGAELPPTDFFANIVSQEFVNFLLEFGYANYSIEEFLLAYKFNADGIKYPSGNSVEKVYFKGVLSVNLSADVFSNYKILRDLLDRKLQNKIDGYE